MFSGALLFAQDVDSTSSWKDKVKLNGYVKFMQSFSGDMEGEVYDQSLWHNRLNSTMYLKSNHIFHLELRNRVLYGGAVKLNPTIKNALDFDNGFLDMSFVAGSSDAFLWSTVIDRLWYEGYYEDWEWSVGRQRINWGINSYFNANDLFNAFNFTDFDYEERPGSDAIRLRKYFRNNSDIEVAGAVYNDTTFTVGAKYAFNYKNYDFQIIAAKYITDWVLGGGWAGAIGEVGFKGEVSTFIPQDSYQGISTSVSVSSEFILKNNKFLGVGGLFSSGGYGAGVDVSTQLTAFQTSAKNLMPTRWSAMVTFAGEINDLSSFALVGIYMPEVDFVLLMPSVTYSMAQNFDLSLHMINVTGIVNEEWLSLATGFVRMQYSF